MADPIRFPEVDTTYHKPPEMTDEQCTSLPTCEVTSQEPNYTLSCWKLTDDEILEVMKTGVVWIGVLGKIIIPFFVTGKKPI